MSVSISEQTTWLSWLFLQDDFVEPLLMEQITDSALASICFSELMN